VCGESRSHGSEGAGAQQCAPATRPCQHASRGEPMWSPGPGGAGEVGRDDVGGVCGRRRLRLRRGRSGGFGGSRRGGRSLGRLGGCSRRRARSGATNGARWACRSRPVWPGGERSGPLRGGEPRAIRSGPAVDFGPAGRGPYSPRGASMAGTGVAEWFRSSSGLRVGNGCHADGTVAPSQW
jgi:hypothetical protein